MILYMVLLLTDLSRQNFPYPLKKLMKNKDFFFYFSKSVFIAVTWHRCPSVNFHTFDIAKLGWSSLIIVSVNLQIWPPLLR